MTGVGGEWDSYMGLYHYLCVCLFFGPTYAKLLLLDSGMVTVWFAGLCCLDFGFCISVVMFLFPHVWRDIGRKSLKRGAISLEARSS